MRVPGVVEHGAKETEGTVLTEDGGRRGDVVGLEESAGADNGNLELLAHLARVVGHAGSDGFTPPRTFVVAGGSRVAAAGGDVGVQGRVTLDEDVEGLAEELGVALPGTLGSVEGGHGFVPKVRVVGLDGGVGVVEDAGVVWR